MASCANMGFHAENIWKRYPALHNTAQGLVCLVCSALKPSRMGAQPGKILAQGHTLWLYTPNLELYYPHVSWPMIKTGKRVALYIVYDCLKILPATVFSRTGSVGWYVLSNCTSRCGSKSSRPKRSSRNGKTFHWYTGAYLVRIDRVSYWNATSPALTCAETLGSLTENGSPFSISPCLNEAPAMRWWSVLLLKGVSWWKMEVCSTVGWQGWHVQVEPPMGVRLTMVAKHHEWVCVAI